MILQVTPGTSHVEQGAVARVDKQPRNYDLVEGHHTNDLR